MSLRSRWSFREQNKIPIDVLNARAPAKITNVTFNVNDDRSRDLSWKIKKGSFLF